MIICVIFVILIQIQQVQNEYSLLSNSCNVGVLLGCEIILSNILWWCFYLGYLVHPGIKGEPTVAGRNKQTRRRFILATSDVVHLHPASKSITWSPRQRAKYLLALFFIIFGVILKKFHWQIFCYDIFVITWQNSNCTLPWNVFVKAGHFQETFFITGF